MKGVVKYLHQQGWGFLRPAIESGRLQREGCLTLRSTPHLNSISHAGTSVRAVLKASPSASSLMR